MTGTRCDISFITLNYNGLKDTVELVHSLYERVKSVTFEVIIVDNHSREDEASELERLFPTATVIRSDSNRGFAGGNNLALPAACGDYLFFINNDALVQTDGFATLVQRFRDNPKLGMISPLIRFYTSNNTIQYAGFTPLSAVTLRNEAIGYGQEDKGQFHQARPTAFVHGAAMMISRTALAQVGPMYEGYFLYYEEMDWSERMLRAGFEIWFDPACVILHKESQTTGAGSPTKTYYLTRNRLLFARRNRTGCTRLLCYAYLILLYIGRALTSRGEHSKAICRGIIDFLKLSDT